MAQLRCLVGKWTLPVYSLNVVLLVTTRGKWTLPVYSLYVVFELATTHGKCTLPVYSLYIVLKLATTYGKWTLPVYSQYVVRLVTTHILEWSSQMSSSNVEVVSLLVMPLKKIRRRAKRISTSPNSDFAEGRRTILQKTKTLLLYSLTNCVPTKTIFSMVKIVLECLGRISKRTCSPNSRWHHIRILILLSFYELSMKNMKFQKSITSTFHFVWVAYTTLLQVSNIRGCFFFSISNVTSYIRNRLGLALLSLMCYPRAL